MAVDDSGIARADGEEQAHGAQVVYETLAEALLNEPSDEILHDIRAVTGLLDSRLLEGFPESADDLLTQRFYDRFFVVSSPFFVPLAESSIRGSSEDGSSVIYGPSGGRQTEHVVRFFQEAGFDVHSLSASELVKGALRPDSLSVELAFLGYLARCEASAPSDAEAEQCRVWERAFMSQHLEVWVDAAAARVGLADDDLYARLVAFIAEWVHLDSQRIAKPLY